MKKERKTFYSNTVMLYILKMSVYFLSFITFPYLTRIFGPAKMGIIGIFLAAGAYGQIVVDFGFTLSATALVSRAKDDKNQICKILSSITVIRVILFVVSFIIIMAVGSKIKFFKENLIFAIVLIISQMLDAMIPDFIYRGIEKMSGITTRVTIIKTATTFFIFLLIKNSNDLLLYALITLGGSLLSVLIGYIDIYRTYKIKFVKTKIKETMGIFKYSSKFFFSRVATTSVSSFLTLVMAKQNTKAEVGYFTTSQKLLSSGQAMLTPISDSMYPYLIKNRDYNLVNKILSIVMPIILIFCTFVVAFNVEFTTLLFGKDFAKAGPVLAWLMPAAIFTLPNYIFGFPMLSMINKEKHANYSVICSSYLSALAMAIMWSFKAISPKTVAILISSATIFEFIYRVTVFFIYNKNKKEPIIL